MNKTSLRRSWLRAACFALALVPLVGGAQNAAGPKDPKVRTIRIQASGAVVSEQFVRGFIALREGEAFSKEAVASTVRSLYATGRFAQATVEPVLDPKTGEVDVVVTARSSRVSNTSAATASSAPTPLGSAAKNSKM
jgi:outer membrane protein assembly factor BamA